MAAFEFGGNANTRSPKNPPRVVDRNPPHDEREDVASEPTLESHRLPDPRRLRQEPIIAHKIYDSCRHKHCLTHSDIGPARYASVSPTIDDLVEIGEHDRPRGDIVHAPRGAHAVQIEDLRVSRIDIVSKIPNQFKRGYWDVQVRYIFRYNLIFSRENGEVISTVHATNSFTKRCGLFGSSDNSVVMATDLLTNGLGEPLTIDTAPFVLAEAKAVALAADIRRPHCKRDERSREPAHVNVTIGLFGIVRLFRIVHLLVESRGFGIPPTCDDIQPPKPCEFFEDLGFPLDVFSPPQKPEFMAGVSENIPSGIRAMGDATPCDPETEDCGE
jgi:hypothetical protein